MKYYLEANCGQFLDDLTINGQKSTYLIVTRDLAFHAKIKDKNWMEKDDLADSSETAYCELLTKKCVINFLL